MNISEGNELKAQMAALEARVKALEERVAYLVKPPVGVLVSENAGKVTITGHTLGLKKHA